MLCRRKPYQFAVRQLDRSMRGRRDPDQCLQQGRLAGAIAPQKRDDLVFMQAEADIVENVALAVERIDSGCRQQRVDAGGGFARTRGNLGGTGSDIDFLHFGAGARILDRAVEQHPAFVHDGDLIGELKYPVDVVFDQQHRQIR